jgi:hypothetical protein
MFKNDYKLYNNIKKNDRFNYKIYKGIKKE